MTLTPLRVAIVVNPRAKRGRARAIGDRVEQALRSASIIYERISSNDPAVCQMLVREAAARVDGFVLVGGDGLVHSMVQLEEFRKLPFAVFPAGSGNDFATVFGFSHDPAEFTRALLATRGTSVAVDAGSALVADDPERRWFAANVSFGLAARVNERANRLRLPLGSLGYKLVLLGELAKGRFDRYIVSRGDASRDSTELLMTVMNIPLLGGGIPLIPDADAHDGLLDVIVVAQMTRRRVLRALPLLASGRHTTQPEVTITRERELTIEADRMLAYADGDLFGEGSVRLRVEPGALRVWAPVTPDYS